MPESGTRTTVLSDIDQQHRPMRLLVLISAVLALMLAPIAGAGTSPILPVTEIGGCDHLSSIGCAADYVLCDQNSKPCGTETGCRTAVCAPIGLRYIPVTIPDPAPVGYADTGPTPVLLGRTVPPLLDPPRKLA
jgi:hypothetical protein